MSLLTVRAAADRMGIGYSTLKQWIHNGKVRTTQTAGGHHRLSEAEIDRLTAALEAEKAWWEVQQLVPIITRRACLMRIQILAEVLKEKKL